MKQVEIISHRSNWAGVDHFRENTLPAARFCLEKGWGIETDIRRARNGRFYISHDLAELSGRNEADAFCAVFRCFPGATVAFNIKESGYEYDLLKYLDQQRVKQQAVLFDMELLEAQAGQTAALFRRLDSGVRVAARVSDRGEDIARALAITSADTIWLDEFDHLWVSESDVKRLKCAGKIIYAISPELHGFSLPDTQRRWYDFYKWGVDGICTDYAMLLDSVLSDGLEAVR